MSGPGDLSVPAIHGPYAALISHAGYYALYAVYQDLARHGADLRRQEYAERLRERLRSVQPLLALVQPYRKSPALRLFTERQSLDRFPPEQVDEAWRQLRQLLDAVGPPQGWPDVALAPPETKADGIPTAPPSAEAASRTTAGAGERQKPAQRKFPKSPVDYTREV